MDVAGALGRLVARGVITPSQAEAVAAELADPSSVSGSVAGSPGRRRVAAEIAGYVGAAFVFGAAALFLGQNWEALGRGGRCGVLAAIAVTLLGSGAVVLWRGAVGEVRRRLASTLLTGGAAAAGSAVLVGLSPDAAAAPSYAPLLASGLAAGLVTTGYLAARSAVGQLGAAVSAYAVLSTALSWADVGSGYWYGAAALLVGVGWAGLVALRWVAERRFGLALGVTFALLGAQIVALGGDQGKYPGYALTAAVAAACFAGYARTRDWVLLAGGVAGATLAVPEFLYEVSGGSLGASGVLLAAGVTLLAGSLAGLRIRSGQPSPPPA